MNRERFAVSAFGIIVILLAGAGGYVAFVKKPARGSSQPTPVLQSQTPTRVGETPVSGSQGSVYENQYMKVVVPPGWTATQVAETVYIRGVPETRPNPAAVNITKQNYILYINTRAQQASGVEGGRFSEIAQGAPSVDAVIKQHPADPCGFSETRPGFSGRSRIDWYVSKKEGQPWCTTPSGASAVWYFSYIAGRSGGYINYYTKGEPLGLVITMAYNAKDVNTFPLKGSAMLTAMLEEMTAITKTLEIKQAAPP